MSHGIKVGDYAHSAKANTLIKVHKVDGDNIEGHSVNYKPKTPRLTKTKYQFHATMDRVKKVNKPSDVVEGVIDSRFVVEATVTEQDMEAAKKKLKKVKSGSQVSFTHHKHGEVTGTYHGMGRMGGRSYAKVDHPKHGLTYVPVHQVKHGTNESVEQVENKVYKALDRAEKKVGYKVYKALDRALDRVMPSNKKADKPSTKKESVEQVDEAGVLYRSPPLGSGYDTRVVSGGYRDRDGKYHPPKTRADMQRDNAKKKSEIRKKTLAAFRKEHTEIDEKHAAYDKDGKVVGLYKDLKTAKEMKPGHTYKKHVSENFVIKHKKTKQVLNTHSDEASARDEHRGLGKDAADYGVYKQTKKDASTRSKLNRGSMKS